MYSDAPEHQAPHMPAAPVEPSFSQPPSMGQDQSTRPVPVVRVLSPAGVEYVFLIFCLWVGAGALLAVLLSLVNGATNFRALSFPTAVLTVALPVFAGLFLHLKKLELKNPALRLDASKRRSTQFTQIIAFVICLFTVIGFVYSVFAKMAGAEGVPVGKVALNALCILVVAGGILSYYWFDEHRRVKG